MRIGIPKELKPLEARVGLVPAACAELVLAGHEVLLESGAGHASGHTDGEYRSVGVQLVEDADALYAAAQMVVKVKEPVPEEYGRLRREHLLFCFLHLAADPELTKVLRERGLTAIGFETVMENGRLPLLAPMSEIAGRIAVQVGARLLHAPEGGKGLLLGGLPGARRGRVVILGAGMAGGASASLAAAMGADVIVFDRSLDRLAAARALGPNVTALYPFATEMASAVYEADLLIGAVLIPGARAPHLVSRDMVAKMQAGSVIIDISVDQGGCVETIRRTTYAAPTYRVHDVLHFGVTNMPGAVPRSASAVLSAVLSRYVLDLAEPGWETRTPGLAAGINVKGGRIVHPALSSD